MRSSTLLAAAVLALSSAGAPPAVHRAAVAPAPSRTAETLPIRPACPDFGANKIEEPSANGSGSTNNEEPHVAHRSGTNTAPRSAGEHQAAQPPGSESGSTNTEEPHGSHRSGANTALRSAGEHQAAPPPGSEFGSANSQEPGRDTEPNIEAGPPESETNASLVRERPAPGLAGTLLALLSAEESPAVHRAAADDAARHGLWRLAEAHQRTALELCRRCPVAELSGLRAQLAAYLVHGGFPEAAIPIWKRALADDPGEPALLLGLGVAQHAAGHAAAAVQTWGRACAATRLGSIELAACRFNLATVEPNAQAAWSEMEAQLEPLLAAPGALTRATVFLQTARAATRAGRYERTRLLLDQAEAVLAAELAPWHPFCSAVYTARAALADAQGEKKLARQWRKKAAQTAPSAGWRAQTVSLDELKGKPR